MKTSNPALSEKNFSYVGPITAGTMTLRGTVQKSFLLIALVLGSGIYAYFGAFPNGWGEDMAPQPLVIAAPAFFIGLIASLAIIFKKEWAGFLSPVYAIAEGLVLGTVSALFEYKYPGIALQAMLSTCAVFVAMLMSYSSGLIQVTDKFRSGVIMATMGLAFVYIIDMVLHFFHMNVPFIHDTGPMGILISVGIVALASLNLILDFDFIAQASRRQLPKFMEWYSSFALLVTLVWLYMEILRLLGKGRGRNS